jgi:hypothetical protein
VKVWLGCCDHQNESGDGHPVLPCQSSTVPSIAEVLEVFSLTKAGGKLSISHPGKVPACDIATWTCLQSLGFSFPEAGVDRLHVLSFYRHLSRRLEKKPATTKRLKCAARPATS